MMEGYKMTLILSGIFIAVIAMISLPAQWLPVQALLVHLSLQTQAAVFLCAFGFVSAILISQNGSTQKARSRHTTRRH